MNTAVLKQKLDLLDQRRAGVLLHITSLPGGLTNGDLGPDSHRFVEFLSKCGLSVWQTLPLAHPHGNQSPYDCLSVHAGNPLLVNLDWLVDKGWLPQSSSGDITSNRVNCLHEAASRFRETANEGDRFHYESFVAKQAHWLDDYALFMALRREFKNAAWQDWPAPLREREHTALAGARQRLQRDVQQIRFEQYVFHLQWSELRSYAHRHSVVLLGDLPIYVAGDSAEVWACRQYFQLDGSGNPLSVSGVPPDYFSSTGQRWGHPLYDWDRLRADGFIWWIQRFQRQVELFDWLRIDHFRALEAYWEIPNEHPTAARGRWVTGPGAELLDAVHDALGALPLVAEDLGFITPEVDALRLRYDLPGMKVLQFAFDGSPTNPYMPHNFQERSVVYTGTHDNDTTLSWFQTLAAEQKNYLLEYLGYPRASMPWPLIQCALASISRLAILPMQDLLALGIGHRMNTPGSSQGNWHWRFSWDQLGENLGQRLSHLIRLYNREVPG